MRVQWQYTDVTLHQVVGGGDRGDLVKVTARNGLDGRGRICTVELSQSMETKPGYVLKAIRNIVQSIQSKF